LSQAQELEFGETLDEEAARLVAVRQNVQLVLAGSIVPDGDKFDLTLRAVDPVSGEITADVDTTAASKAEVLAAVNTLAADMRKDLGDESQAVEELASGETVTATSLEALKHYVTAQDLARQSRDEQAIEYYAKAIEIDPTFARAYSGWGLSAFKIGRQSEAEAQWEQALGLLDRMTRREQHRTLGLYYTRASLNYEKAIETYAQLTTEFPADSAGLNNLSVLYFLTSQFDKAVAESARLIEIYPERTLYLSNHALNAMWAGDFETAVKAAEAVIEKDREAFKPYMVLAMVALDAGNLEAARDAYQSMATTGARGHSLASIGIADVAIFEGRLDYAKSSLTAGLAADSAADNERGIGTKTVALAQTLYAQQQPDAALGALAELESENAGDGQLVPTAELLVALDDLDAASEIAAGYAAQLRPKSRAYAALIEGMIAMQRGEHIAAIDALRAAIDFQDLWIVRFYLGQAYLAAGYPAEAASEFDTAWQRRGEAMAMFFDDVPTWRYMARLEEWREKARQSLSDMASG
jgi:tetratricopeptide (TPR) repeat protein